MGFWDFLSDVKDSADKSREAREYLQRAKELVREGDDIYERAYNKVHSYAMETESRLRRHVKFKKDILDELGSSVDITLKAFKNFDIDSKTISSPVIKKTVSDSLGSEVSCFGLAASKSIIAGNELTNWGVTILDMIFSDVDCCGQVFL